MVLPSRSITLATFLNLSRALSSLYGLRPRTRLSASALNARSMIFEKSRTMARPSDAEPLTAQSVVASAAPPSFLAIVFYSVFDDGEGVLVCDNIGQGIPTSCNKV